MSSVVVGQPVFNVMKHTVTQSGLEVGILENGIPYLTERGLARVCGVDHKTIAEMAKEYSQQIKRPRIDQIRKKLLALGYTEPTLFIKGVVNGTEINAYVPQVCITILEYYAFDVANPDPEITKFFRSLAGVSFQEFLYNAAGYNPRQALNAVWQQFTDRVSILADSVPPGYFSVFKEISGLLVDLINSGIPVGPSIVPDISVGIGWGGYWRQIGGEAKFGPAIKYEHNYPDYFPQAASNPQTPKAYPDEALPIFRKWFREEYIPKKYPGYIKYLGGRITKDAAARATEMIAAKYPQLGN